MKKSFFLKNYIILALFILFIGLLNSYSQLEVPFAPRLQNGANSYVNIKGDYTYLANGILNRRDDTNSANVPYNGSSGNNGFHREYIDIDGDPSTFSSSSSTLTVPDCSKIYYAGLYWSANYEREVKDSRYTSTLPNDSRRLDFTTVKLKVPGGTYINLTADNNPDPAGDEDQIIYDNVNFKDSPYVCYKNVTNQLQALANPNGQYTVANVRATRGVSVGGAGGWTLVIIYENPTLTGKYISVFDGYAGVTGSGTSANADITVSGFNTIPVGPVKARLGASVVEGDRDLTGDAFQIKTPSNPTFSNLTNSSNPSTNFFNSNITIDGANVTTRNIASTNTLGYDADIFNITNNSNNVIANSETSATLRLHTNGDAFGAFLVTFGIEIIEPTIILEKRVEDIAGNDITGQGVNLGQTLDYVLSFKNTGNDDGTNYTIKDILPINTTLNEANFTLPAGVTYTYDEPTRTVLFSIPDNLIEEGDPLSSIRMRVVVASNCFDFVDACTDIIQNVAYSTYEGKINDNQISDDPSVSNFDACGFTTPGATNFLLDDLSDCTFTRTVQLCGDSVLLDAGDNFDDYIWYRDVNNNNTIDIETDIVINDGNPDGDKSTQLVTQAGNYIVDKIVADPCKGFNEIIKVELFGTTQTNPILDLFNARNSDANPNNNIQGEILRCSIDGEYIANIFLCGSNASELLEVNIPDATSIEWQKLDETNCTSSDPACPNKGNSCYATLNTGNSYSVNAEGSYRLVINYQNGCSSRFYFSAFKNNLNVNYDSSDIICNTQGNITVTNIGSGYGYQLVNATTNAILVPYSANNGPSFSIATNGTYRVDFAQLDGSNTPIDGACVFSTEDIGIRNRDFQVEVTKKDTDCNGLGEINLSALNVEAQYYFQISKGGVTVDTYGPTNDNNYRFTNISAGTYDITVTTDDGCVFNGSTIIENLSNLTLDARVSQHITCKEGNIQMDSGGGKTPHTYAIWSYVDDNGITQISYPSVSDVPPSAYQTSQIFDILNPGDYTFIVVDRNNCSAISNTVTIEFRPAAEYNATTVIDALCFGQATGSIRFNLVNSNGFQLTYFLIDSNGIEIATNTSGYFPGLNSGDYSVRINQRKGSAACDYFETFTIDAPSSAISANSVLIQDYTCLQNGSIEVQNVTGGTAPYSYSIDGINFIPDSTPNANRFENLTNGTYTITIRDASSCNFTTNSITIDPKNEPTDLTFAATTPNCPLLTSDVTVSVIGGNSTFNYDIIAPLANAVNNGNNNVFVGLSSGTYTFRVTDSKGCVIQEDFTIAPVTPITVSGSLMSNVICLNDANGEIQFTLNGFSTNYSYTVTSSAGATSIPAGNSITTNPLAFSGLSAGTYTITVTDNTTNCTATDAVTVNAPSSILSITGSATQPTCSSTGSINTTATGGWGSYSYELIFPDATPSITNTNGSFNNLTIAGNYNVIVTDANGCTSTVSFIINAAIAPTLEIIPNDVCYTNTNGLTLTANVIAGGDGNYQYSRNGGIFQASNVFSGLTPGTHTITVRDGKNCTDTKSITINPELTITASASAISACGTSTNITISAAGGDGNFVYAVVANGVTPTNGNFSSTNPVTITNSGDYDVYIRDKNGASGYCQATYDITIVKDAPLVLSVSNTDILCSGQASSTITIGITGGKAPFSYSINNGSTYQTSNTFINKAAGSYNIRVRDANNCQVNQILTITEPFTLSASAAVTELVECNPTAGGEVRITNAQGGTMPYEYSFDGGLTFGASAIGYLMPGTHTVYIKDANGCDFPMSVTIDPAPNAPTATASVAYECDGEGTITISPSSSNFDYTYAIDGTPNTPDTSNIFDNITPGNHTITVNYLNNTTSTPSNLLLESFGFGANTSITQIDPAYCYEPQNGSASLCGFGTDTHIQDGEYSVTQVISNPYGTWQSPNDHTGNANGRFLAINVGGVAGVGGIVYAKRNIEVIANRDITISLWAFNLLRTGTSGGDPTIEIQLVDGGGAIIASTATGSVSKNNNADDWHNYTVTLNPGANSNLDIVIRTNSAVEDGNDIAIDDIQAFQTPEPCPGSFDLDVLVEDGNAFAATTSNATTPTCFGSSDASITFDIENFDPINGFIYSVDGNPFSGVQTSSPITVNGLNAGTHIIVVQDALDSSCAITINETINDPTSVVAAGAITDELTCTNGGATITASATGGTPAYMYQLEDDLGNIIVPYKNSPIFTNIPAGNYFIWARDTNLCADAIDAALIVNQPQDVIFTATPTACYSGNSDGLIQVDVTSGNGKYQFRLNSGPWLTPNPTTSTTYNFNNLTPGSYAVDVKDQFGCPVSLNTATVVIENKLLATVTVKDISCIDGSITVNATGGDGLYQYAFVPTTTDPTGLFGASNVFTVTNGNDGTYDVYVRDNSAVAPYCEVVKTVTVKPAVPLNFTATPTDPECHDGFGTIVVTISSGTSPYTIQIIDLDHSGAANQTNTNVFAVSKTYYNLIPGNYTISITDAFGCVLTQTPIAINNPDELTADIVPILPAACSSVDPNDYGFRFTNYPTTLGRIEFSADGGATWVGDNTIPGTSDEIRGYVSGESVYPSMRTVDGSGNTICQTDLPRYIIPYPLDDLDITISTVVVNCNELQVTVQGTEGVPNYEYAYTDDPANFNPATAAWTAAIPGSYTWTGLIPGRTYVFYVRDSSGCIRQSNVNVNDITVNPIQIDPVYEPSCFGQNDGEITYTLTDTDGSIEPNMRWELFDIAGNSIQTSGGNIAYNPTITVSGLAPNEYYIVVTEVTSGGVDVCISGSENLILEELDPISGTLSSLQNITCSTPGLILVDNLTGGGGNYNFTITGPAGFTTITATTNNPIEIPANSPSGTYTVTIQDQYGCGFTDTQDLILDPTPEISLQVLDNCPEEGEFQLVVTLDNAGIAPYQLSWNGQPYQSVVFDASNEYIITNLSSGANQTLEIRDANGCGELEFFTIYPPLEFTAIQTELLDCEGAPNNNAEITIEVQSGSGTYEYEIVGPINSTRAVLPSNPYTWTDASVAGVYSVIVYDMGTPVPYCSKSIDIEAPAAIVPDFTYSTTNVTCNGADDGSIKLVETDNGVNPLTYSISPVAGTFNAATKTFENLPPDTYTITGQGTNQCTLVIPDIIINEPAVIAINNTTVVPFACAVGNNKNNASITVDNTTITGGSGNYVIYEFINDMGTVTTSDDVVVQSSTNRTYVETNIAGGTYIINVYDDNGCIGSTTETIAPYDKLLTASAAITNNLSCSPGADGEITITATSSNNDDSKFEYSIDNGANYQSSNVFSGLSIGSYNFLIRHIDTGCIITASQIIENPNTFSINVIKVNDVVCFGTETGEITLELVDATYVGPFDWVIYDTNGTPADSSDDTIEKSGASINNGPTTSITLFAGSYIVEVMQTNFPSCNTTEAFTISGPSAAITGNSEITAITCALNDGIIEVVDVLGGWGGYLYYVSTTANPDPTDVSNYVSNPRFENLVAGTYEIWVIDQKGCPEQLTSQVLNNPTPITGTLQVNQENCINLQGEIEVVSVSGGQNSNYTYQLYKDGLPFGVPQTDTTFSGLGAGSYTVEINDQWSCTFTTAAEILYEEITVTTSVVKLIDCTATPDGAITVNVSGGSANLEFEVTFPDGVTTQINSTGIFTGLSQSGTYTFEVRDVETGIPPTCIKTITEYLDAPTPVTFASNQTVIDVSCNGGSDGSITIVLAPSSLGVNDNPVYTYNLYDALGTTLIAGPQTNPTFSGLSAATYTLEAISSRGCLDRTSIEVNEPTLLTISAAFTPYACAPNNTVNTSTITVTVNNDAVTLAPSGTAPYLYSINGINYQTANTFKIVDNGSDQTINIFVKDGKNCIATETIIIPTLNTFTAVASLVDAIDCVNGRERVLITVTEAIVASGDVYSFELLPVPNSNGTLVSSTATTAIYDLSAVGNYTFRVTNTTTGCYVDTASYTIAPYDLIKVAATATTPVTCMGDGTGELTINVSGYSGSYSYEVFNQNGTTTGVVGIGNTATNPQLIGNLSGGNYFVRITETTYPSCSEDSNTITIISPTTALTGTATELANVTCTNDKGELLIEPIGGYAPYNIQLTNSTTGQIYPIVNNVVSYIFTGLSAGDYVATITDNGGCTTIATETLTIPSFINATITPLSTMLTCYGDTNGSISAIGVTGGQGTYQYQLNYYDATGTTLLFTSGAQNSPNFNNLSSGIYSITVSDVWDCDFETIQVEIIEPNDVIVDLVQSRALTCSIDAQMTLTATGGQAPYSYSVDNTTFVPFNNGNSHVFTITQSEALLKSKYQYYVIDQFGCSATISNQVSIDPIPDLLLTIDDSAAIINCSGDATATIIASASGGLGNYSYELYYNTTSTSWLNTMTPIAVQTTKRFENLSVGFYYVRVLSGDCELLSAEIEIEEPEPLTYTDDYSQILCAGDETGYITVQLAGGSGEYQYAISPNLSQFDDINTFTNLAPGNYTVIAQDKNGCFEVLDYVIEESQPIVINATANGETCLGNSDGSIDLTITGGIAPYSTRLENTNYVAGLLTYTDLPSGTHTIFVIDDLGCETSIEVIIDEGVNIKATVEPIYECTGDTPDNYLIVTLEDPSLNGEVLYQLDDENSTDVRLEPSFTNIPPGNHTLITSLNGCVEIIPFTIENFEPLTLVLENNTINEITAVAAGGSEEYTFYFDDKNNGDDNTNFIYKTGTYIVRVVDANGCEAIASIEMEFIDIEIPNFFTPDGDGENDTWKPINLEGFPNILIIIFDRYGREVYRMRQNDKGWDGIYHNSELPTGDYWYIIKLKGEIDDREFVGHFTLYR